MKTSTILIIAGAGVVVVYFLTRPKTTVPLSKAGTAPTSFFGALGQFAGGILTAGGSVSRPSSPGVSSGSFGVASSTVGMGADGDTEVEIVRSLDAGGIGAYDAQGTASQPVFGIAGLDYS